MSKAPVSVKPTIAPPKNWRWSPIQAVARLESGHTPSRRRPEYWGGDIPWLSLKDIQELRGAYVYETADMPTALGIENSSARVLPKGTVALCRTASVGKVAILGRDMATSQDFVDWVCGAELHPEYLFWALRASSATFDLEKQGSTHKTIYMPVLERLQILLPPIDEQRRIAAILDKADDIRCKRQEALALAEALLRSTFLEMFGDLSTNPRNWHTVDFGEVIAEGPSNGLYVPATKYGHGVPIVRIDSFDGGSITNIGDLKRVSIPDDVLSRFRVKAGQILVNRVNSPSHLGKAALVPPHHGELVFESNMMRIILDGASVIPEFAIAHLQSEYIRGQIATCRKDASNQSSINQKDVRGFRFRLPPVDLQQRYRMACETIMAFQQQHRQGLVDADALFESLTHRAFTGQL